MGADLRRLREALKEVKEFEAAQAAEVGEQPFSLFFNMKDSWSDDDDADEGEEWLVRAAGARRFGLLRPHAMSNFISSSLFLPAAASM